MPEVARTTWTRESLMAAGFVGWVTFETLMTNLGDVPRAGGVYVVVQQTSTEPDFLKSNPGGWFKGRNPTVDPAALHANWVEGADVVYVGKAENLRRRLRQFAQFGAGQPIGHWGGRLIWQLARSRDLLVAWRETPDKVPREVETRMLADFRAVYGHSPFANDPHRLGR